MSLTEDEVDWYWYCSNCGIDIPYLVTDPLKKTHDEYYTQYDERNLKEELDLYFYQKYPEFRQI